MIKITAKRLTDWKDTADFARATVWKGSLGHQPSSKFKTSLARSEHSPLRTVVYRIDMLGIPSFVSVHFVRHKMGVEHFVSSNRPDRNGGKTDIGRWSPVNHLMFVNAQELIFMARRRLCKKASRETQWVMRIIREAIRKIDPEIASAMVPDCHYRHECVEFIPCYMDSGQ